MEKDNGIFDDEKLLAFWQQQRKDALKALTNANRQIAYLSNFVTSGMVEVYDDEEDWIYRGNE